MNKVLEKMKLNLPDVPYENLPDKMKVILQAATYETTCLDAWRALKRFNETHNHQTLLDIEAYLHEALIATGRLSKDD